MQIRVYVEDTDLGGIVYHANYLKYCERARSEAFFKHKIPLGENGCFFAVKSIKANYVKPAYLGDLLDVDIKVLECKKASFTMNQTITREGEKVFEATLVIVYLCGKRPKKIPQKALDFLLTY